MCLALLRWNTAAVFLAAVQTRSAYLWSHTGLTSLYSSVGVGAQAEGQHRHHRCCLVHWRGSCHRFTLSFSTLYVVHHKGSRQVIIQENKRVNYINVDSRDPKWRTGFLATVHYLEPHKVLRLIDIQQLKPAILKGLKGFGCFYGVSEIKWGMLTVTHTCLTFRKTLLVKIFQVSTFNHPLVRFMALNNLVLNASLV